MRVLMITFLWRLLVTRQWVTLLVKITKLQKYENENKILHGNSRYAFPHGVCFFSFFFKCLGDYLRYLLFNVYCVLFVSFFPQTDASFLLYSQTALKPISNKTVKAF